jgi:hypothetical protein
MPRFAGQMACFSVTKAGCDRRWAGRTMLALRGDFPLRRRDFAKTDNPITFCFKKVVFKFFSENFDYSLLYFFLTLVIRLVIS